MERIWSFFIKKQAFSFLLIIGLVLAGLYSAVAIPKESNPEIVVPIGVVTTVFPGAAAEDIEELVTDKIEEQLSNNLEEVKKITSTSRESVSSIVVEFNADADIKESIQDIKDEVDKVKTELPEDAEDPSIIQIDFADEPIMLISIQSSLPVTQLISLSDDVIDELKTIRGVSKVEKSGLPEREVQVIVRKEALQKFQVNLLDVVRGIQTANGALPVGSIKQDGIEYAVRFDGDIDETSTIGDIAIFNTQGEPIFLRDLAFVSDGVSRTQSFSRVSVDGGVSAQAVSLSIFKKSGGDITRIAEAVREKLADLQNPGELLESEEVLVSFDVGEFVKEDLQKLSGTGLQTVLLVMIILLLAIGWRESLIAGLSIPLSFLIAFIGLRASGNTINFVSLFSLILAVGILVDSAIVITEGIHLRIGQYPRRRDAALATIKEFHWPLTSGTMTTIAVFAPLFIVSGITGQFIASIPFTIIFVLLASLFVALGVVPILSALILRKKAAAPGKFTERQEAYTKRVQDWYRRRLRSIIGERKKERLFMIGITALFIFSILLPVTGVVKTIFFPGDDSDFVFVEIEKPEGTTLGRTDLTVRAVEEILYEEPRIESFVTTVGKGSAFVSGGTNEKLANITVLLKEENKETSTEMLEILREQLGVITSARISVSEQSGGPPTGSPVTLRFLGDDLDEIGVVASKAETLLKEIPGTVDVDSSAKNDSTEFVFRIDRAKASELGVTTLTVAQTLRTAIFGLEATSINTGGDDIDVIVKLNLNEDYITPHDTIRTTTDTIRYLELQTPRGPVLLGSIVDVTVDKSNAVINHEDRSRIITVTSDVREGVLAGDVLAAFQDRIDEINMGSDVELRIGGEAEEVNQSFKDMGLSLIVGLLLILAILVLQFNSFKQALLILSIVPLCLIGIFIGLAITGKTLSFPSIMGFIALAGIVVNNSIILVDRMNNVRKENQYMALKDVVIEAAVSRLRPILLTTLTTVIGIIPLTYASALWSPLAYAIMFGLTFAVIITLVLVPVLYVRWMR